MTDARSSPVYSLCISNWNSMNTVQRWADSLLANLEEVDEVIIVDGESKDGSGEFLRRLSRREGFTFIPARTTIGEARDLAVAHASGDYIISQLDTDDIVVSLPEIKRLYHEVVERDPVTGRRRAFYCPGSFILPRDLMEAVGGYSDLHYYEDQLLAYRLSVRGQLTGSWKVSAVVRGSDPKKSRLGFRLGYSFKRVRDGLRLGIFTAKNLSGYLLLPPAWLASRFMSHHEFGEWWRMDIHRDEFILPWVRREGLGTRLLIEEAERTRWAGGKAFRDVKSTRRAASSSANPRGSRR